MKRFSKLQITIAMITIVAVISSTVVWAYFEFAGNNNLGMSVDANILPAFGKLDASVNPAGEWGTDANPYLITNTQQLMNLYTIQNNSQFVSFREDAVFQISDTYGNPCYVGGNSFDVPMEMNSIGNEDFPFVSILRGVKATNQANYLTLPDGEVTDTSVIGNVRVTAEPEQIDIGLFGNIGRPDPNDPDGTNTSVATKGGITNLLLYNIQISTQSTGGIKADHPDYTVTDSPQETNHIGILAGHAEYCTISDISVYYTKSDNSSQAKVNAFDVGADASNTRYTTAGGIIGFYKQIMVGTDIGEPPASSDSSNTSGGTSVGLGLGIVYSQDIWSFMEKNYFGSSPAPQDQYGIQDTFDSKLYGTGNTAKTYFQIGVFTFAHSTQVLNKDTIAKLWIPDSNTYDDGNDNNWRLSTSNNYTNTAKDLGIPSRQYQCKQITLEDLTGNLDTTYAAATTLRVNASIFPADHYRFMLVAEPEAGATTGQFALTRYGYTIAAQRVDTTNFVIPESELNNYTFEVLSTRTADTNYPPYTTQAGYRYSTSAPLILGAPLMQYLCYGYNQYVSGTSGKLAVAVRPLRIYDTASFMATSSSNSPEGVVLAYEIQAGGKLTFTLQRTINGTRGSGNYLTFSEGVGFGAGSNNAAQATSFRLYAVRYNDTAITTPNYSMLEVSNTMLTGSGANLTVNTDYFPVNNYRFMLVYENGTRRYALTRNGNIPTSTTVTPINGIARTGIENVSFQIMTTRSAGTPSTFSSPGPLYINPSGGSQVRLQYLCYGTTPVPMRLDTNFTTLGFSYTDANTGTRLTRSSKSAGARITVTAQRVTAAGTTSANYLRCSTSGAFSRTAASPGTSVRLFAVCVNPSPTSDPTQSQPYLKQIYTPSSGTKTYDMSQNVLFYTGDSSSSSASAKYTYDMVNMSALNWMKNDGNAISNALTALKMGDSTSYYYLYRTYWGVTQNIPAPDGATGTITVPQGSIAFTVQGTGTANTKANIFVIVATDPTQLVDQLITVSYFNPDRTVQSSFALPPVPDATTDTTTPIYVKDLSAQSSYTPGTTYSGSTYTAYPNLNTLLVAYEISVPSTNTTTYFLEASRGTASFVYLSAERTAANDNNPIHKNDIVLKPLTSIDYVSLISSNIATIGSTNYVQSLVLPYFGLISNPNNPGGANPSLDDFKVLQARGFKYNVYRYLDTGQNLNIININVTVPTYPATVTAAQLRTIMQNMNFNFVESSYVNTSTNQMVFSDLVGTTINNLAVDWKAIADLYP